MGRIVLSGSGVFTPPYTITNEELVAAFNDYVATDNERHRQEIEAGSRLPLQESSAEFISKASGIRSRYVMDREGILDPERMCPRLAPRAREELSLQAEISVAAARQAMKEAGKEAAGIDAVIVSCSSYERAYPAIAIEVQEELGIDGFAYDMNVACSSATFALQNAVDAVRGGQARAVLVVNPEICSGHLNFRDRDSHFIFGDVCTAMLVEGEDVCGRRDVFEILGTRLATRYSTNIYNGFGFLDRTRPAARDEAEKLFSQEGRKVFKEVVPLATAFIRDHLAEHGLQPRDLARIWLHQANLNMNQLICKKLFDGECDETIAPTILDTYANTASAGSVICFHFHHGDLRENDLAVLCSFGAGYSVGSAILRRVVRRP